MRGENSRQVSIRGWAMAGWRVATAAKAVSVSWGLVLMLATSTGFAQSVPSNSPTLATGSATSRLDTLSVSGGPKRLLVDAVRNRIYVGSGGGTLTVIDGSSNAATEIAVGSSPDAFAVSPLTNKLYAANSQEPAVTVINGTSNSANTLDLDAYPRGIAVNVATNRVYVTTTNPDTVTVINSVTDTVVAAIALTVAPQAIAVNPATNTIYVASPASNRLLVIDGGTNAVTNSLPVGNSVGSLAVDPAANLIYAVNEADNTVTVVAGAGSTAVATVSTGDGPRALAVNPVTGQAYVANANDATVTVIDGQTYAATTLTLSDVNVPCDVAVDPAANKIYVVGEASGNIAVLDGATGAITTLADASASQPAAVAVNPLTGKVYVANQASSNVTVVTTQPEQASPLAVSITPLAANLSATLTPSFEFQATSTPPVTANALFYQVDTWQGTWLAASSLTSGDFTGKTTALQPGLHVLYAYATGSDTSSSAAAAQAEPFSSNIAAYGFVVAPPSLAVSSSRLDFGYQRRGVPSTARTVTLANLGGGPLALSTVAADGDFSASNECGSALAAFASCPVNVIFTPKGKGNNLGALTVSAGTSEALAAAHRVTLTGHDSTGPLPLFSNAQSGSPTLAFSAQLAGTSSTLTETLQNVGDAALTTTASGMLSATLAPGFTETDTCGMSLPAGNSCTITVKFTPTSTLTLASSQNGLLLGAIELALGTNYTTVTDGYPAGFGVRGTGEVFAFSATTTTATVAAGQAASYTVQLAPVGGFSQTVALTCSTAALDTTCAFSPSSSVSLDGTNAKSVTITLTTTARSRMAPGPKTAPPFSRRPQVPMVWWWSLLALAAAMILARRYGLRLRWALLPAMLLFMLMCAACGGNGGVAPPPTGTTAGAWVVTITGTAGTATNTTALTLNVT